VAAVNSFWVAQRQLEFQLAGKTRDWPLQ
jgi:hypothetical protein